MKISDVKTFIVRSHRADWVFVKIYTDDAIEGVGEASLEFNEHAVVAAVEQMKEHLLGTDPFAVEHHCEILTRNAYWRDGAIFRSALSGIEGALMDVKGKALNVPAYELLGGKVRDRIKVYANTWMPSSSEPEVVADKAREVVESGFRALKFDPFFPAFLQMGADARTKSMRIIEAVRNAVGDDIDILIEGHGRFDVQTAILIGHDLAQFKPFWFEEPIPPESLDAMAYVCTRVPVPVATGERFYDHFRCEDALMRNAADVLQPDIAHIGGMTQLKKMAHAAQAHYRPVAPHNVNGPVANAMTLQVAASTLNVSILETCFTEAPWRRPLASEQIVIEDGEIVIPELPGLGVTLDEEVALSHPYQPYTFAHYDVIEKRNRPGGNIPWYTLR